MHNSNLYEKKVGAFGPNIFLSRKIYNRYLSKTIIT